MTIAIGYPVLGRCRQGRRRYLSHYPYRAWNDFEFGWQSA
jgi:hypothetical protein